MVYSNSGGNTSKIGISWRMKEVQLLAFTKRPDDGTIIQIATTILNHFLEQFQVQIRKGKRLFQGVGNL